MDYKIYSPNMQFFTIITFMFVLSYVLLVLSCIYVNIADMLCLLKIKVHLLLFIITKYIVSEIWNIYSFVTRWQVSDTTSAH